MSWRALGAENRKQVGRREAKQSRRAFERGRLWNDFFAECVRHLRLSIIFHEIDSLIQHSEKGNAEQPMEMGENAAPQTRRERSERKKHFTASITKIIYDSLCNLWENCLLKLYCRWLPPKTLRRKFKIPPIMPELSRNLSKHCPHRC